MRRAITQNQRRAGAGTTTAAGSSWLIRALGILFPVHTRRTRSFTIAPLVGWSERPFSRADFNYNNVRPLTDFLRLTARERKLVASVLPSETTRED